MRARMYDPRTGRFTQTDPIRGNRPWDHYLYASNNPVSRIDPMGTQDWKHGNEMILEAEWVSDETGYLQRIPRTLYVNNSTRMARVEMTIPPGTHPYVKQLIEKELYGYSLSELQEADSRRKFFGALAQTGKTTLDILEFKAGAALTATVVGAPFGVYLMADAASSIAGDVVGPQADLVGRGHEAVAGEYAKYTRPGAAIVAGAGGGVLTYLKAASQRAAQDTLRGFFGVVTRRELEAAARSSRETIRMVTSQTQVPMGGRGLSVAIGEGAEALAGAVPRGGTLFEGQVPKDLVDLMLSKGLAQESKTLMNGVLGTEIRFYASASEYIAPYLKQVIMK